MPDDLWQLVVQGEYQRAVDGYTSLIQSSPRIAPHYVNRAVAYLGLRNFADAERDYAQEIARFPSSDEGYIGLGVCQWCQRQFSHAIVTWKDGLDAVYTDAAGGVEIPALLLYAALRTQDMALQREVKQLLRKHARRKQLVNWPGAIVPYLLGQISTEELQAAAHWPSAPAVLLERHNCQVSFYVGVRGLLDLDESACRAAMRECAASWYGFLEQEYYLATWEVENDFPEIPPDQLPRKDGDS